MVWVGGSDCEACLGGVSRQSVVRLKSELKYTTSELGPIKTIFYNKNNLKKQAR